MKKKRVKKVSGRQKCSAVRKKISQVITWIGIVLIGILAVPTSVLIALISVIWSASDKIAEWVGEGKRRK